jgi:glycosyltransferase involved in cell wall biosynthesis
VDTSKNILLLIPQLTFGGAERVFHDQARELASAGHHVTECVFESTYRVDFKTQNQLIALDAPPAGRSILSKAQALRHRVARLRKIKQELNIDVCISHLEGADYLNLLSKGTEKVFLCVHNSKRHDLAYGANLLGHLRRRVLMPTLYRRADRVVTVSRDLRQEMIEYMHLPASQVVTINNFVEIETIHQRAAEPLIPAEESLFTAGPVMIAAGRLDREKNQLALLPVMAALRASGNSTVRLLLLGDGKLRSALVAQAQALGLSIWDGPTEMAKGDVVPDLSHYDIVLLGFRANPFPYIAKATLNILPSLTEGFPMALCESMACGVPVASVDCPTGPREILAPATSPQAYATQAEWAEFGLLLPLLGLGDEPTRVAPIWAEALNKILTDPVTYQHYVAQSRLRADAFGPRPVMARWEKLLQNSDAVL